MSLELEQKILSYLTGSGEKKALDIAKGVDLETAKDVNGTLYRLQREGKLHASNSEPPRWSLSLSHKQSPSVSPARERTINSDTERAEQLLEVLRTNHGDGITAKKLAQHSKISRRDVNRMLYSLSIQDKIGLHKLDEKTWALTDGPKKFLDSSCRLSRDFEIIQKLGEGGFGHVYKVKHKLDKKLHALKIVKYTSKAESEVDALVSCEKHPNIINYVTSWQDNFNVGALNSLNSTVGSSYETHSEEGGNASASEEDDSCLSELESSSSSTFPRKGVQACLFIQMEFCEGGTLSRWLESRNFGETDRTKEEALQVFRDVVCGVKYIHSHKLIHRDLKPDNILFTKDNMVKIGDFGLVTSAATSCDNVERTVGKGTASYMSPEQENQRHYDEKTDIFPLGLICFELVWKFSTIAEKVKVWPKLRNRQYPTGFDETFPSESAIITKMLSESPKERPNAEYIAGFIKNFLLLDKNVLNEKTV